MTAEETGIDKNAGQLIADRAVHQGRGDSRVDATGQTGDDARFADLFGDTNHVVIDERARGPRGIGVTHVEQEVRNDFPAPWRVRHLRVEHQRVHRAMRVAHGADDAAIRARGNLEARRRLIDVITVAHPHGHLFAFLKAIERAARFGDFDLGAPIFAYAWDDRATGQMRDELHAVADAEHWGDVEQCRVGGWDVFFVDRIGAAAQDDPG